MAKITATVVLPIYLEIDEAQAPENELDAQEFLKERADELFSCSSCDWVIISCSRPELTEKLD